MLLLIWLKRKVPPKVTENVDNNEDPPVHQLTILIVLLHDCFLNAVNDVANVIIGYVWTCWQAETDLEEGF